MRSMTGYGYASENNGTYLLEVELKGYNGRYLDIQHNIAYALSMYEDYVDKTISRCVRRGRVDVAVRLKVMKTGTVLSLDEKLFSEYLSILKKASQISAKPFEPSSSDLFSIEGMVSASADRDPEAYRESLGRLLSQALDDFVSSRIREGEETKKDLLRLGKDLENSNERVGELVSTLGTYFKDALLEKTKEVLSEEKIDDNRLMQEVGALLVKYSINEEQNRIKTHLAEYFRLLESDEPVGKKLDFLCQEINREVNTTASKSQNAEINLETVKMKDSLENIREQIRNVE